MRLDSLTASESPGGAGRTRFETLVADITGAEDYRLVIDGPDEQVRRSLAEGEITIRIDPKGTRQELYAHYERVRGKELERLSSLASLEKPLDVFTRPSVPDPAKSVLISLHRIRGHGSFYEIGFPWFLGLGESLNMLLPPVCVCMGDTYPAAVPEGGMLSLTLALNFASTPVATSGPGPDNQYVSFGVTCWPWANFIPWFTVMAAAPALAVSGFAGATFFP